MSKNLFYVLHLVQMDLDDYATNRVQKYLQYCIMGYRDLHLYAMPNIKVAYLTPNDALVADLPQDYERYTKIGMCLNGQIWTLTLNPDLCLTHRLSNCGIEI